MTRTWCAWFSSKFFFLTRVLFCLFYCVSRILSGFLHALTLSFVKLREPLVTNIMWRNLLIQVCGLSDITHCCFILSCYFHLKKEILIARILYQQIHFFSFLQALYQIGILLVLNFQGKNILSLENGDPKHANMVKNTLIFNAFVFCQVSFFILVQIRREKGVFEMSFKNYCLIWWKRKSVYAVYFFKWLFPLSIIFFVHLSYSRLRHLTSFKCRYSMRLMLESQMKSMSLLAWPKTTSLLVLWELLSYFRWEIFQHG